MLNLKQSEIAKEKKMLVFKIVSAIILTLYFTCIGLLTMAGKDITFFLLYVTPLMCAKMLMAYLFIPKKQQTSNPGTFLGSRPCKEMEFQPQSQVFGDISLEQYSRCHVYDSIMILNFQRVKVHNAFTLEELQDGKKFKSFITCHLN
jgi:hypothetical protein